MLNQIRDQIKILAERISKTKNLIRSEEATKTAADMIPVNPLWVHDTERETAG